MIQVEFSFYKSHLFENCNGLGASIKCSILNVLKFSRIMGSTPIEYSAIIQLPGRESSYLEV